MKREMVKRRVARKSPTHQYWRNLTIIILDYRSIENIFGIDKMRSWQLRIAARRCASGVTSNVDMAKIAALSGIRALKSCDGAPS